MAEHDEGPWQDDDLRRLARKKIAFPLDVSALSHAELIRRLRRFLLIFAGAEFAALAILFATMGVLPGFIDRSTQSAIDGDAELTFLALLFGLPLASALLVWLVVHRRYRRRPDEADHPWRFRLSADGMEVTTAQDRRLAGPWSAWTYRGYRYVTIKHSRVPIALHVACEGTEIAIEFFRFRRREATQIIRGVLQGLESAGNTDRAP